MKRFQASTVMATLTLTACTSTIELPPMPGPEHPASPEAEQAPVTPRSPTLDLNKTPVHETKQRKTSSM